MSNHEWATPMAAAGVVVLCCALTCCAAAWRATRGARASESRLVRTLAPALFADLESGDASPALLDETRRMPPRLARVLVRLLDRRMRACGRTRDEIAAMRAAASPS